MDKVITETQYDKLKDATNYENFCEILDSLTLDKAKKPNKKEFQEQLLKEKKKIHTSVIDLFVNSCLIRSKKNFGLTKLKDAYLAFTNSDLTQLGLSEDEIQIVQIPITRNLFKELFVENQRVKDHKYFCKFENKYYVDVVNVVDSVDNDED